MRERLLSAEKVKAIDWRDGRLQLLDQRRLPLAEVWHGCDSAAAVAAAIEAGRVRGAAAIELAAACGLLLGVRARLAAGSDWRVALDEDVRLLAAACPQSLAAPFGALQRLCERLDRLKPGEAPVAVAEATLAAMLASDREVNLGMAQLGAEYIRRHQGNPQNLLTHCGGGALASAGFGTALGVIRAAHLEGLVERVYVDEARPGLQGARLAAWELDAEGVPVTLNADACAAHLLKTRGITWVIVGAERIAANGDVLGLLGTYQLAVLAMHHGARFMVVAPTASIDMALESGEEMVIDEQAGSDLLTLDGQRFAADVEAFNPLFDVTPADLVDVIVSEKGIVEQPGAAKVAALMCRKRLH